ncbi:hypothetical protein [Microbacterium sp. Marseille-Q6965]|uniref:hypothetical protein n=1 Tax=Microbacterium sp. Marseille-Q6965 TaxID=2965072 RepID=UPI0021B77E58|nr:hypothetical protein [Microbacterium sp. Marseille-Q6965]
MTDRTTGAMGTARLRTMRTIALAYLGAIPVMTIALVFVAPSSDPWGMPDLPGLIAPAVVGVAAWAGIITVGFRVPPLPASNVRVRDDAGVAAYQSTMFVRMAFATLPALVSVALLFSLPGATMITYAIGGAISLVLLAVYVYPNRFNAHLVERRLDGAGARSGLVEALGLGDGPATPTDYTGSATFH